MSIDIPAEVGDDIIASDNPGQLRREAAAARSRLAKDQRFDETITPARDGRHIRTLATCLAQCAPQRGDSRAQAGFLDMDRAPSTRNQRLSRHNLASVFDERKQDVVGGAAQADLLTTAEKHLTSRYEMKGAERCLAVSRIAIQSSSVHH